MIRKFEIISPASPYDPPGEVILMIDIVQDGVILQLGTDFIISR